MHFSRGKFSELMTVCVGVFRLGGFLFQEDFK